MAPFGTNDGTPMETEIPEGESNVPFLFTPTRSDPKDWINSGPVTAPGDQTSDADGAIQAQATPPETVFPKVDGMTVPGGKARLETGIDPP